MRGIGCTQAHPCIETDVRLHSRPLTIFFRTDISTVEKSDLSYIFIRYTRPSISAATMVYVMTLAPPDLPLPLEAIAILIFRMPGLSSTPWNGLSWRDLEKSSRSCFNDLCLLARALNDLSKSGVGIMSKFIEHILNRSARKLAFLNHLYLFPAVSDTLCQYVNLTLLARR